MKRPIASIVGTGRGLPEAVMTNFDFAKIGIETTDEWITERTGIKQRHIARNGESTMTMAAAAARQAMQRAGVSAGEIDAIVLSTATPDRLLPATAVDLQAELGATRAAAFDIGAACAGFIFAVTIAEGMIATGTAETVLVVGSEKMSSIIDCQRGILSAYMRSDGTLANLLYRPSGGACQPFCEDVLNDRSHFVKMAGREVFKHAVRSMADACDRALDGAKLTGKDIDLLIPHQANLRIIEATAKHASVSMEKVYVNVDRYGNTSSASVAIALDEALENGRIKEGMNVLVVAFGAGFTWASMVLRF
jgi:3-oxoacyl-[acyl-carrier-protein] synthase-3